MVAGDGEGHQLFQGQFILGIKIEEPGRDGGQLEALFHHRWRDEETGGDLLLAETLVAQGPESPELIERMQGDALNVLGEKSSSALPSVRTTQGTAWVLAIRFCLTSNCRAR